MGGIKPGEAPVASSVGLSILHTSGSCMRKHVRQRGLPSTVDPMRFPGWVQFAASAENGGHLKGRFT